MNRHLSDDERDARADELARWTVTPELACPHRMVGLCPDCLDEYLAALEAGVVAEVVDLAEADNFDRWTN